MSIRDFEACPLSSTDFQAASTWLDALNVKTRALGTTLYVLPNHVSPDVAIQESLVARRTTRFFEYELNKDLYNALAVLSANHTIAQAAEYNNLAALMDAAHWTNDEYELKRKDSEIATLTRLQIQLDKENTLCGIHIEWIMKTVDAQLQQLVTVQSTKPGITTLAQALRSAISTIKDVMGGDIPYVRNRLFKELSDMSTVDNYTKVRKSLHMIKDIKFRMEQSIRAYGGINPIGTQMYVSRFQEIIHHSSLVLLQLTLENNSALFNDFDLLVPKLEATIEKQIGLATTSDILQVSDTRAANAPQAFYGKLASYKNCYRPDKCQFQNDCVFKHPHDKPDKDGNIVRIETARIKRFGNNGQVSEGSAQKKLKDNNRLLHLGRQESKRLALVAYNAEVAKELAEDDEDEESNAGGTPKRKKGKK